MLACRSARGTTKVGRFGLAVAGEGCGVGRAGGIAVQDRWMLSIDELSTETRRWHVASRASWGNDAVWMRGLRLTLAKRAELTALGRTVVGEPAVWRKANVNALGSAGLDV